MFTVLYIYIYTISVYTVYTVELFTRGTQSLKHRHSII